MREVFIVSQLPPPAHGSTIMTARLIEVLREIGCETRLLDRRFSTSISEIGRPSPKKVVQAIGLILRLIRALLGGAPLCIFFLTNRPGSFVVDCLMLGLIRLRGVPIANYIHTNGYQRLAERGPFWSLLVRFALSSASHTVVLGESMVSDIRGFVDGDRITIIPNSPPSFDTVEATGKERVSTVLFYSNFIAEKGPLDFLELARAVTSVAPNVRFRMAGNDSDPVLGSVIRERAGKLGSVEIVGRVDGARRADLLRNADLLVFPSIYQFEAQPLSVLEAFAFSVPVVAYDVGGLRDIVEDGENGYLVDPGDLAAMTSRVTYLVEHNDIFRRLSAAARMRRETVHSKDAFALSWSNLIGLLRA
jgi:glycosyltransferase involved in cell wall biosynthesis